MTFRSTKRRESSRVYLGFLMVTPPLSLKKENMRSPVRECRGFAETGEPPAVLGSSSEQGYNMARVPGPGRKLGDPRKPLSPAPNTEGLPQSRGRCAASEHLLRPEQRDGQARRDWSEQCALGGAGLVLVTMPLDNLAKWVAFHPHLPGGELGDDRGNDPSFHSPTHPAIQTSTYSSIH